MQFIRKDQIPVLNFIILFFLLIFKNFPKFKKMALKENLSWNAKVQIVIKYMFVQVSLILTLYEND